MDALSSDLFKRLCWTPNYIWATQNSPKPPQVGPPMFTNVGWFPHSPYQDIQKLHPFKVGKLERSPIHSQIPRTPHIVLRVRLSICNKASSACSISTCIGSSGRWLSSAGSCSWVSWIWTRRWGLLTLVFLVSGLLTGVAFFNGVAGLDLTLDPFASSLGAGLIGVTFFLAFWGVATAAGVFAAASGIP